MVPASERGAAHLRSRRRGLRDRRRACRPDRRARGRAARLVGRGAGGRAHRLERVGPQRRLRAARICRVAWTAIVDRVGLRHAKALWALSEWRRRICAQHDRRDRACRASTRSTAGSRCRKTDNGDDDRADVALYGQEFGAEVEGWPTERVREVLQEQRTISRRCIFRARFTSIRSTTRSGSRRRREAAARASSRTRRRSRSIRRACASGSRRRTARARAPCGACRQRPSRIARCRSIAGTAGADLDLCGR